MGAYCGTPVADARIAAAGTRAVTAEAHAADDKALTGHLTHGYERALLRGSRDRDRALKIVVLGARV